MDTELFVNPQMGSLVDIKGFDPELGEWSHKSFMPTRLPDLTPELSTKAHLAVANARASLASLDSLARQLPNPTLLRMPSLRREAQSTSALEGTYAPLSEVLTAGEEESMTPELQEIFNYVDMAYKGFQWHERGLPITAALIEDLQGALMQGTSLQHESGRLRDKPVVIGRRPDVDPSVPPVFASRFVPAPPGDQLRAGVGDLVDWMREDHSDRIDPVVSAAMAHYQFEALHPFRDGNGRLGRFLIVLHLLQKEVLQEPTLTVSPWFEARRTLYYDALFDVSARGDWDNYISFFAKGIREAAESTRLQMIALLEAQEQLKERIRGSQLRSDTAHGLVELAVGSPSFTVPQAAAHLGVSYNRANRLVSQLLDLDILRERGRKTYKRRFYAPAVLAVFLSKSEV